MATKDSRLAQIYRQELAKNKGLLGAFASAGGARIKEAVDLRQYLLPQSGISGAIAQRMFGKSYRYNSGQPGVRTVGSGSTITDRVVSEKISRIDTNTKLTAKNTIVLPAMARDMNLMRMNMQKMVKISGGTPSTKADMFFKRAGDRESAYESQFKKSSGLVTPTTAAPTQTQNGGLFSGILEFLKMPLFNMFGSLVGMLVKGGLITAVIAGIGSLIRELVTDEDFRKSFTDTVDSVAKSIFGEDVWKNLAVGVAAAGAAFLALNKPLDNLLGIVGSVANGLTGLVSFMIKHPVIFGATVAAGTLAYAVNRIANVPKDDTPLTNKEIAESQQSAASGGFESAQVRANKKRKMLANEKALNTQLDFINNDTELLKQKKADLIADYGNEPSRYRGGASNYQKELDAINDALQTNEKKKTQISTTLSISPTKAESVSTSPEKVNTTGSARQQVEAFLGKTVSDNEYSALLKAVSAEASSNGMERAAVATVILNRAKQHGGSIIDALNAPKQFHAITGPDGKSGTVDNPWSPNARRIAAGVENSITENLSKVDNSLTEFRSMNAAAWKDVGGENRMKEHLADLQSRGGKQIGQQLFASGGYAAAPSAIAATPRNIVSPSSPDKEDSMIGEVSTMLAGVFKAIGETNNSIQSLAVASASSKQQQSASIASPYDKELYELLLGYHSDVATPIG